MNQKYEILFIGLVSQLRTSHFFQGFPSCIRTARKLNLDFFVINKKRRKQTTTDLKLSRVEIGR